MKYTGSWGGLFILIAFIIFGVGAALEIDRNGFSMHHMALVLEGGLTFYMAALLFGSVTFGPA